MEMPSPSEIRKNTTGNAKLIAASASVLYRPSQIVSTRLYVVWRRFVTTIGSER